VANVAAILSHSVTVHGFRLASYSSHRSAALADLKRSLRSRAVSNDETVIEGIENAPEAFISLFRGANTGKMLMRVSADG
jgi:NADPH-dependent curcumin reductase CurA